MSTLDAVPVQIRTKPTEPVVDGMPTDGPLIDSYGRVHTDLRLSITDQCNLRCVYCLPETGARFLPRRDLLDVDELVRFAHVAHDLGVTSLRVTGGEPLLHRDAVTIVARLAEVGFEDLSLTTNGTRLTPLVGPLADAGLDRVNISCDSLNLERFATIRRRGELAPVLASMDAAEQAGLGPVKVNVVVMAGVNDDEIVDFAAFARRTGRIVRFIEFMPLDAEENWERTSVVSGAEIIERIGQHWPLEPVSEADPSAPAQRFAFTDGVGQIGVIASVTRPFCGTCDRLRLTADGALRNCLFSRTESSVRDLLRGGATDTEIAALLRRVVWGKLPGHGINDTDFLRPARSMSMIGG